MKTVHATCSNCQAPFIDVEGILPDHLAICPRCEYGFPPKPVGVASQSPVDVSRETAIRVRQCGEP